MRARHAPKGEKGVPHRAHGGSVEVGHLHRPHDTVKVQTGEGEKAKMHAGKRARGGSCWYCGGAVHHAKRGGAVKHRDDGGEVSANDDKSPPPPPSQQSSPQAGMRPSGKVTKDQYGQYHGFAGGGGIHIKPSHKGLLHKDLHVASSKHIPEGKLAKAEHSKDPAVRKRAVFAENAKHWHH